MTAEPGLIDEGVLTISEAAAILRISRNAAYRLSRQWRASGGRARLSLRRDRPQRPRPPLRHPSPSRVRWRPRRPRGPGCVRAEPCGHDPHDLHGVESWTRTFDLRSYDRWLDHRSSN